MVVLSEAEAAAVEVAARVTVVAATATAEVAVVSWVWFETVDVPVLVLVSLCPGRRHPRTRRCPRSSCPATKNAIGVGGAASVVMRWRHCVGGAALVRWS